MIKRLREFFANHLRVLCVVAAVLIMLIVVFCAEGYRHQPKPDITIAQAESTEKPKPHQSPVPDIKPSPASNTEIVPTPSTTQLPAPDTDTISDAVKDRQNAEQNIMDVESSGSNEAAIEYSEEHGMELDPETGTDRYGTDPVPAGMPLPEEPQEVIITNEAHTCTLSISCSTILNNISRMDKEKHELVPADGMIFPPQSVSFNEGESVFDLLERTMRDNGIHMEFVNAPMYNSAYIEGINNIYEFDCGSNSGWMYKVNGWFPNYGCSRYALRDGDVVEWVYTCNGGDDLK